MTVTIYHNPRCSKSRKALEILHEKGLDVEVIEYLKTPPDKQTLERLLTGLGLEPRQLMRTGESVYKELGLDNPVLSRDDLIDYMINNPILIERPVVVEGSRVVIGRPPENVLEIL